MRPGHPTPEIEGHSRRLTQPDLRRRNGIHQAERRSGIRQCICTAQLCNIHIQTRNHIDGIQQYGYKKTSVIETNSRLPFFPTSNSRSLLRCCRSPPTLVNNNSSGLFQFQSSIPATKSGLSLSIACICSFDHWLVVGGFALGDPGV